MGRLFHIVTLLLEHYYKNYNDKNPTLATALEQAMIT